jgi:sugar O-acyltransferase (sialic acid O-acetyltransferase NeuD family)
MRPLWVIGAGGHAKVVIDTARASGLFDVVGVLDDDPTREGSEILNVPVLGPGTRELLSSRGVDLAIVAVGSNAARVEIVNQLEGTVSWATIVHPHAYVAPGVRLGEGAVVFAGAVIQPDVSIGRHSIVNTSSSVDHDCVVGDFAHIAPGARLAGGVRVGMSSLVGIGSCVIPGRKVGRSVTIGARAVVIHDVPDHCTAVGVPARWEAVG